MRERMNVEELKESEVRFRSIFENSLDAILLTIPSTGAIIMVNPAACRLFGMTEEELQKIGRAGVLVVTENARVAIANKNKVGSAHNELTYRRKDGTTFVGEVASSSFSDANGIIVTSLIIRDITDRRKAEVALHDSEERFRLVAEAAKVLVYEIEVGVDVVKIFRGEEVLGYKQGEIPVSVSWWLSQIHPDDRVVTNQKTINAIKMGQDAMLEYRIRRKQGDFITTHDTLKIVKDHQGKVVRVVGGLRDVTYRKKEEETIKENARRLELAQRVARLGSWEFFVKEDKAIWSRELFSIFGLNYQAEAPNIADYSKFIHPDDLKAVSSTMNRFLAEGKLGETTSFDYRIIRPDRLVLYLHSERLVREVDEIGKVKRIIGIEQDITERKQLENRLEEYTKNLEKLVDERTKQLQDKERLAAIGETAGMVGHDIRNPLQAIVSELYLARQAMAEVKDRDTKDALESINMIQEQVDYISKIVSDLQDYARHLKPDYCDVDLTKLVVGVFETISYPDNIKLNVDVRSFLKIRSDPTFLKRALTNLINNAIQAMPDGGELGLNVYLDGCNVFIAVLDTGKGIPEVMKSNIFKPLVTTKAKGQGLGLAVVKRLVEAMGGKVSFESEERKGTKFIIKLPLIPKQLD